MKPSLVLLCVLCVSVVACSRPNTVVVGSKNFTEQIILAEILARQIERRTALHVERRLNLTGTLIAHQALISGQIDLYPEYTGTALMAVLKKAPIKDAKEVRAVVTREYAQQFSVVVGDSLGFENTFAILVRGRDARQLGLKTISDAAKHSSGWKAGFGYEFMERADGFPGLSRLYGLTFSAPPKVMDLSLTYRALADGQVDMIAGNSTDGLIAALDLFMLRDERHYFPPYEAVPLIRQATLDRFPQLGTALAELKGTISEEAMRRMNAAVDLEHRDPKKVAADFLK
jgi:glycine betaine/choline ABC-type transport system substrate-binding protein